MNRTLFALLLALTLVDLGFVQATDVVPAYELLPLWALAAAAPWLRRLQRYPLYRVAWNACVVLVFALLVHHATTSGLLHMLEDGLVLAVLCQVHLLNNIGERQRPDLVFFNSFLIAFVTSFFTTDAVWSALFLVHSFALVTSLQLYSLTRSYASLPPALLRAVWRDCAPRTLAIVAVTGAAFVLAPRDFRREGWLGDALALGQQFESGIAERIRLDDEHTTRLPENVVARISPASGHAEDVPAHWRANAFSTFAANAWTPQSVVALGSRFATDPVWQHRADGSLERDLRPGRSVRLRVQLFGLEGARLPVPLTACTVSPVGASVTLSPRGDGAIKVLPSGDEVVAGLECAIDVSDAPGRVPITPRTRAHMVALPEDLPGVVHELAARLRRAAPDGAGALELAAADCEWLQQNRRYQLPGRPGFAHGLGEFLLGSGAGHCEYFATALALVLRAQRVPCRVVGGWLAHEWDAAARAVVVRGKHAHAWIEVLAEDGSWHTFDPTPAQDVRDGDGAGEGWFAAARASVERWWSAIAGFDQATRDRWLASLAAAPVEHPFGCGALLAAVAVLVWRRRRRRQALPTIVALHRALRRAGLSLRCGETTRELLARAAGAGLAADVQARLQAAAHRHEHDRYAGAAAAPGRR